ncbi:MAG TPA: glycosyltransferase [Methanomicrobia archaeon]|nr:glycosyltransferase [Methanomicrobia archaeon]
MRVNIARKSIDEYKNIVGNEKISEIKEKTKGMKGLKVLHFNSTSFGGGGAEMLHSLVPLMKDIGIDAEWKVMDAEDDFFEVTKTIHNGLQGMEVDLTEKMKKIYLETNKKNSDLGDYDIFIIHDPQPVAVIKFKERGKWVWRCHIDTSKSNRKFVEFLKPYISEYDASIFTIKEFGNNIYDGKRFYIAPSIDPLSEKNRNLKEKDIENVLSKYKIDMDIPIITQVSRFDPWKDPMGVIEAYRYVKKKIPSQLILIGSMANDDPEGLYYYKKIKKYAKNERDIILLTNLDDAEVNAFQRASDIVVQKSLREGFGLTVTEAMWKEKPVVATKVGGIPLQIEDGKNGFLVGNTRECAEKIIYLLKNKEKAEEIGEKARKTVKDKFLITRHILDYLRLMEELM